MAHWAEIDGNNTVIRVIVTSNDSVDEGYSWIVENLGGNWVQTSYNANFRKNYAGAGYTYNSELDAFIPPKPYPSWVLNENTCVWEAPIKSEDIHKFFTWDEENKKWI